ncbi:TPA: insulinase family protein [Clostridium botulinum]|uniref:M16 family metallopeptidase n=1 Tax=Clostridium TaxID=1485 RepID=UPI0007732302|nr:MULTISPECIES: pitrilysin family protein [Clostridium]AUM94323.1 peptidase M16 [Clostridium sporogenes]AVQ51751.1 insulinase family protein [Clostridium botulinum]EKO1913404.1 insulinase family protein [Clostridium botulinum]EKO2044592.1 insulinase family protein [Clostridium botulinum]MCW6075613.1 insulinase family protein [Clostridium sporogenes]
MNAKSIDFNEKVKNGVLKNGLVYYIYENNDCKDIIRLSMVVKVGSLKQEENKSGIAHFTEHMCVYNSLKAIVNNNQDIRVFNGYTNFNETVYYLECKLEDIEKGLIILRNILLNKIITKDIMEKVRKGLVDEIKREKSKFNFEVKRTIFSVLSNDVEFEGKLPLGQLEYIEKCKYESINEFHNKWYKPNNSAICCVGNIKNINVNDIIQENFSELERKNIKIDKSIFKVKYPDNRRVVISNFKHRKTNTIQFYYLRKEDVFDLKEKSIEYFVMKLIESYIKEKIICKNINFENVSFFSTRLLGSFQFDILTVDVYKKTYVEFIFSIIKELILNGLNEFEHRKKVFLEQLKADYNKIQLISNETISKECINNFLYDEPLISLSSEYNLCYSCVEKVKYNEFNLKVKKILQNPNFTLVINNPSEFMLDKKNIYDFWDWITNIKNNTQLCEGR